MNPFSNTDTLDAFCTRIDKVVYPAMLAAGNKANAEIVGHAAEAWEADRNPAYLKALMLMRRDRPIPATIREFVESDEYLGKIVDVWPKIMEDLERIHPDMLLGATPITETILASATGSGKSVVLQISMLYTLYLLNCFKVPQHLFVGLNKYTPIVMVLQSVRDSVTRRVLYKPLRQMFLDMPYTRQRGIQYNREKESVLEIEGGIEVAPMLANIESVLGSAIIAAALDEVNFMNVIDRSKKVAGARGQGGKFDQAEQLYSTLIGRRVSRFVTQGISPGGIYLSSSVNYSTDFLARRIEKVEQEKYDNVVITKHAQFDVRPTEAFTGAKFLFIPGTDTDEPIIVRDEEHLARIDPARKASVREIPTEYRQVFDADPHKAQRDILSIASSAIGRFITRMSKVSDALDRGRTGKYGKPLVVKQNVDYSLEGLPAVAEKNLPDDLDERRYVHVDLAYAKDMCGIAMCKVAGYKEVTTEGVTEELPEIVVELAVSLKPTKSKEIDIAAVRRWVLALKEVHGFNLWQVTYDGFQSKDSIQVLRNSGIRSETVSLDRDTEAYDLLKRSLYEDRLVLPDNGLLRTELLALELITSGLKDKVDHPPSGSKDIADAVCGCVFAASTSRDARLATKTTYTDGASGRRRNRDARKRRKGAAPPMEAA